MKKIISVLMVCVLLVGCMLALVSCGGLSGTYSNALCDLKFSGNKVTAIVGEDEIEGTYEIKETEDGKKTISFDFIESEEDNGVLAAIDAILGSDVSFSEGEDSITIARVFKFTKK